MEPKPPYDEWPPEERLAHARLLVMEMQGVLTDGRLWLMPGGGMSATVSRADLLGLKYLLEAGRQVLVLCDPSLETAAYLCRQAGVEYLAHQGDKQLVVRSALRQKGLEPRHLCYFGADMDDLAPMFEAGVSACPPQSPVWVREAASLVTEAPAGMGAVREICQFMLRDHKPEV